MHYHTKLLHLIIIAIDNLYFISSTINNKVDSIILFNIKKVNLSKINLPHYCYPSLLSNYFDLTL